MKHLDRKKNGVATNCTYLDQIHDVVPSAQGCEKCSNTGNSWVHLRECLGCGHVGCYDSSLSHRVRNALSFRATLAPDGAVALEASLAATYLDLPAGSTNTVSPFARKRSS